MSKEDSFLTKASREAAPKSKKKNKMHKRGFNEGQDIQTKRHNRINFKNYLRELEEANLDDELMDDEE